MMSFNPPNVSGAKVIVYDTETTGLNWNKDKVCGYVITLGPHSAESFYFPVRHETGPNYDPECVVRWIKEEIASRTDIRLVGHNLKFDLHMSHSDGIDFATRNLDCTQVGAALLDENYGKFSLEDQCIRSGVEAKKGEDLYRYLSSTFGVPEGRRSMEAFWRTPADHPLAVEYAEGDGTSTYQLFEAQQRDLANEDLERVYALERRVLRTLVRMERIGVRVDRQNLDRFQSWLQSRLDEAESRLPKDFNPRSPKQVAEVMEPYKDDWVYTAAGNPSFKEEVLEKFPGGQDVLAVRKILNLYSKFIDPILERHLVSGRIHTNFNQTKQDDYGTIGSRLSSSEPNMQAVPKRDKTYAPPLRHIFVAEDGCFWSANDYAQQEYVVFTEYTRAPRLVEGYRSEPPVDIHSVVGELLGVERDPTGKRMNMGMLNGMGYKLLAANLGVDYVTARVYKAKYLQMLPEVDRFNKGAERRARREGFVKTILGRKCRFPNRNFCHKAPSRIIQGTSGELTKLKMVEVDEFFERECNDEPKLQLQIHDDLNWSMPKGATEWDDKARAIMRNFGEDQEITLHVPMRVDAGTGANWGEACFPKYDWSQLNGQ